MDNAVAKRILQSLENIITCGDLAVAVRTAFNAYKEMSPHVDNVTHLVGSRTVPGEAYEKMRAFVQGGKKINAIKLFREVTDASLKEAKDVIDGHSW